MKHVRLCLFVVLAASLVLGACGAPAEPQASPVAATPAESLSSPAAVTAAEPLASPLATTAAEPLTSPLATPPVASGGLFVVDALGRTVEFEAPPQRIVVAGRSSLTIVDTLFLFPEAADRVIGIVVGNQNPSDFLSLVDPGFKETAILEVEAGPEQIAPLKPDLVIARSFVAETLGTPLEQVNIPVLFVDLETPEQYFRDLAILGQVLGNETRAAQIRDYYQSRLDTIAATIQGSSAAKPSVLLLQYSDRGGEVALNVPSASWLQTTEVELAGGNPVWKDAATAGGWTVVNFEQIAAWDPDKIFVIHYQVDSREIVQKLVSDSKWQALKAVQSGEIYGFPADAFSWDQPDPRWILGVSWLASKTHPDLFPDLDMEQEAKSFFVEMFNIDPSTVDSQILPNLKGQVK